MREGDSIADTLASSGRLRLAYAYDRLAPETLGGAERYYATLCAALTAEDSVAYLTRAWWGGSEREQLRDGVRVVAVSRRRPGGIAGKLLYAVGLAWHLLRHGGRYEVVHACCFPYTSVLAAWIGLLPHRGTRLVIDWHEVLTAATWRRRLGRAGVIALAVQRLALQRGDAAVTFSRMHAARLAAAGFRRSVEVHPEFHPSIAAPPWPARSAREPVVLFAGRLVAEKRPAVLPAVISQLRRNDPRWRAVVFGQGPEDAAVRDAARREGVEAAVQMAGFAPWDEVARAMLTATVLVLPTVREGFGLVVLEAAAHGLPSVLVDEPDNAAVELIENGRNGLVVASAAPDGIAQAVQALAAQEDIHDRCRAWYDEAAQRLSVPAAVTAARALHAGLME